MAQTCIVCLGDLRALEEVTPAAAPEGDLEAGYPPKSLRNTRLTSKNVLEDDEIVAHLLPCAHDLHNSCLKPWVERANSCPICRTTFNMVELSLAVGGATIDSYAVQDKVQEAEIDPSLVVEYDPVLEDQCEVCSAWADMDDLIICHFCEYTVHAQCVGVESADLPNDGFWCCNDCTIRFGSADRQLSARTSLGQAQTRRQRRRTATRPLTSRNDGMWARIWLGVSRQLDLDLDFPFDTDDDLTSHRTPEQRREFSRWQRRFDLAERQGNSRRFHALARLRSRQQQTTQPQPESQENLRAWNAFEKARESQDAPASVRRKRRRSHDSTPGPDSDVPEPQQLKRPRLRPPPTSSHMSPAAESSTAATRPSLAEPTFLSSLLKEVEQYPITAASPSDAAHDLHSPRNSSPARSPAASDCASPRPPATPPPQYAKSPPLSSTIAPPISPAGLTFSPFSPIADRHYPNPQDPAQTRGRKRTSAPLRPNRNDSSSPGAGLSYSSKEEIQRMVKLPLSGRYRNGDITKEQYTDINRDVSRKMYEMVGDASALSNEAERAKWQAVAEAEVTTAVRQLQLAVEEMGSTLTSVLVEGPDLRRENDDLA